ncbi:OmpA family protein [Archangium gephyra]|uniref:OmpA family protein n=1 Tax=Archangium gephyra TaxID=48 RepID=UPI0035D44FB8
MLGFARFLVFAMVLLGGLAVEAGTPGPLGQGFPLNRYEPTPAGESSFRVDVPRFGTDGFSLGFGLDYAHKPLVLGVEDDAGRFQTLRVLIEHQAVGHLDVALRLCDCTTLSVSLPLVLLERGRAPRGDYSWASSRSLLAAASPAASVSAADLGTGFVPLEGMSVSDPRLGMMLRLYGTPEESPFSVSLGGYLWIPLRKMLQELEPSTSGQEWRAMPRLVLAGRRDRLQWSFVTAYLWRPEAHPDSLSALTGGAVGSEVQVGAHVSYSDKASGLSIGPEVLLSTLVTPKGYAFRPLYTELDALLGLNFRPTQGLQVGLSAGVGLLRRPGTPDFRFLLRVAYSPERQLGPREVHARPPPPVAMTMQVPAPVAMTVPVPVQVAMTVPVPVPDRDGDGVLEPEDLCPETPRGAQPDAARPGCPASDRDQDTLADAEDACPDAPGAPSLEHGRNGCPGLVEVKGDRLLIREPIVFATNTDTVLEESFPVLQAMADALVASPWIHRVRFEGHTDNQGTQAANRTLSLRRARSVVRWLQVHGVDPARMEATGHGQTRPVASNDTEQGRAANRRVDIIIIDPPSAPEGGQHP